MPEIELSLDGDLNLLKGGHLTFEITDNYIEVSGYIPEPKEGNNELSIGCEKD